MAPAESIVEAEGEGGGRTTPLECCDVMSVAAVVVPRGDPDSFVALPPSDSSGICTVNRGREMLPPTRRLLDREGGVKTVSGMVPNDPFLLICGCGCALRRRRDGGEFVLLLLETLPTSIEWDLLDDASDSGSGWNAARCRDKIDRFPSSMGVKMLPRGACLILVSRPRRGWRGLSTNSDLGLGST